MRFWGLVPWTARARGSVTFAMIILFLVECLGVQGKPHSLFYIIILTVVSTGNNMYSSTSTSEKILSSS